MTEKGKRPGAGVRRREIIEAAIQEFGSKNYHWATTKEIAKRAGVSERVIFFYFNNKKDLYRAVVEQVSGELMKALARGRPPADDLRTYIKMGVRNLLGFMKDNPLKLKLLVQGLDTVGDPDFKQDYLKAAQGIYDFVHAVLNEASRRGEIPENLIETTSTCIAGISIVAIYADILGVDWFMGENEDIFQIGDRFIDLVTGRK